MHVNFKYLTFLHSYLGELIFVKAAWMRETIQFRLDNVGTKRCQECLRSLYLNWLIIVGGYRTLALGHLRSNNLVI